MYRHSHEIGMICRQGHVRTLCKRSETSVAHFPSMCIWYCLVEGLCCTCICTCKGSRIIIPTSIDLQIITFIGEEVVVRIPGRRLHVPRSEGSSGPGTLHRPPMPTWEEQTLVIGASFAVAAFNGRDPARRVSITGFCQVRQSVAAMVNLPSLHCHCDGAAQCLMPTLKHACLLRNASVMHLLLFPTQLASCLHYSLWTCYLSM